MAWFQWRGEVSRAMVARGASGGAVLLLLSACGGSSNGANETDTTELANDTPPSMSAMRAVPASGRVEPIRGPCPTPLGNVEELAQTPRADVNLELLALSLELGNITASQATYDRVVADVTAMRRLAPELVGVDFLPSYGPEIIVTFSDAGIKAWGEGKYTAWDCLNQAYAAIVIPPVDFFPALSLQIYLGGVYDMPRVAALYERLPEVLAASIEMRQDDGPKICASRDGARFEYVIDRASVSCEISCQQHDSEYFASDAAGEVTQLAEWNSRSGDAVPTWFAEHCSRAPMQ